MSFLHLNDKLSIGGGLAINYAYYFQELAVRNIDPSYGDGEMELEASDVALGYICWRYLKKPVLVLFTGLKLIRR